MYFVCKIIQIKWFAWELNFTKCFTQVCIDNKCTDLSTNKEITPIVKGAVDPNDSCFRKCQRSYYYYRKEKCDQEELVRF